MGDGTDAAPSAGRRPGEQAGAGADDGRCAAPWRGAMISMCPDGPLLVRGEFVLSDADGDRPLDSRRKVVALCRCGRSELKPFCDGSHRRTPRSDQRPPHSPENGSLQDPDNNGK